MFISNEKLNELIADAPLEVSPDEIISELRNRGYQFEFEGEVQEENVAKNPIQGVGNTLESVGSGLGKVANFFFQNTAKFAGQTAGLVGAGLDIATSPISKISRDRARTILGGSDQDLQQVNPLLASAIVGKSPAQAGREMLGTTAGAAAEIGTFAAPANTVGGRIASGATIGTAFGASEGLQDYEGILPLTSKMFIGGTIGAAVSGTLEALGYGLRRFSQGPGKRMAGAIYDKELQPPTKEVAKQIEYNWKTIGNKVSAAVDDQGRPVYYGSYGQMKRQAERELRRNNDLLLQELYKDQSIKIKKLSQKETITKLEEVFGALDDQQLRTIEKELARLPKEMILPEALKYKRLLDSRIDPSFWIDPNLRKAFVNHTRYILRDAFREAIEQNTTSGVAKNLSQKLGLAVEVRELVSLQMAIRRLGKNAFGLNQANLLTKIIDKFVFNPQIVTRVAQRMQGLGTKTGQTATRNVTRNLIIRLLEQAQNKQDKADDETD